MFGIPIRVHITLLLFAPWIIRYQGLPLGAGLALLVLLFSSIALHELGHSLMARAFGCRVREILLLPFGGVAQLESMPRRPLQEFMVAIAGPAVSLLLALGLPGVVWTWTVSQNGPSWMQYSAALLRLTGYANLALLIFNLLPAFPMDGGRVLRATLTPWLGRLRATRWASRLGRLAATGFGIWAVFGRAQVDWMLLVIAVFLYLVAGKEYRAVQADELRRAQQWNNPWTPGAEPPDSVERVVVSPPPYAHGGREELPLRVLDRDARPHI
ncbi:MAG: site-2 protease family protein [bacterium]